VILLSPQGAALDHAKVLELASAERLVLVCARYEAVDERLVGRAIDEELSIGDYGARSTRSSRSATTCCRAASSRRWW